MGSSNSKPERKRSTRPKKKDQPDMEQIRAVALKIEDSESELDWGTERVRNLMSRLTLEQKVWIAHASG